MCGRGKRRQKNNDRSENGFEQWGGYMAAKKAKLLDQFHDDKVEKLSDIFAGIQILVNGLTNPPAMELKKLMAVHGGEFHMYQSSATTHIIASNLPNVKIKNLGIVPIVKPAWITESIALNKLIDYRRFLLYTKQSRLQPALNFHVQPEQSCSKQEELPFNNPDSIPVNNQKSTKTASDPKFLEEFYSNSRLHLISTLGSEFKHLVSQLRETSTKTFIGREKLKVQTDQRNNQVSSIIMHIDMDCFFVSVGLRKHPDLRGQPVAITHARSGVIAADPSKQAIRDQEFALYEERLPGGSSSRISDIKQKSDGLASMSEIASCSYEARQYGIKNGMFLGQAVKLCPNLKTLPYDFEGYKEVSTILYKTVASYTLDIEAVSCDEMYVDVKDILRDTGLTVEQWGFHIRKEIMDITGCPCSTGFGANRLQARLATKKAKPAGQYYLKPEDVALYMAEIPLGELPGVGRATVTKLTRLGFNTCGELLEGGSVKVLQAELGLKLGERIWEQAQGIDSKSLDFNHERKSVSTEVNYGIRFKTKEECYTFLESMSKEVFTRLSEINMRAKGLTLKLLIRAEGAPVETAKFLGHGVCDSITKSSTSNIIYSKAEIIFKEVKGIYDKLNIPFAELRGIGIQLTKLEKISEMNKALNDFLKRGTTKQVKKASYDSKCDNNIVINKAAGQTQGKKDPNGNIKNINTKTLQSFWKTSSDDCSQWKHNQNEHLRNGIAIDVFNELPPTIRSEIMKEYHIDVRSVTNISAASKTVKPPSTLEKIERPNTPFVEQSWENIKESVKSWIKTENQPSEVDVDILADYLRNLALNRQIEILFTCCKFFYRKFSILNCKWHKVYITLIDAVQQGMLTNYGKMLYIDQATFSCCKNK